MAYSPVQFRLDYARSLYTGIASANFDKLKRIQNTLARIVMLSKKRDPISIILQIPFSMHSFYIISHAFLLRHLLLNSPTLTSLSTTKLSPNSHNLYSHLNIIPLSTLIRYICPSRKFFSKPSISLPLPTLLLLGDIHLDPGNTSLSLMMLQTTTTPTSLLSQKHEFLHAC